MSASKLFLFSFIQVEPAADAILVRAFVLIVMTREELNPSYAQV